MKKYQFEEITMGISIIIALLAYRFEVNWVFYIFTYKAIFDFFCAVREAYKSILKDKKNQTPNAQN